MRKLLTAFLTFLIVAASTVGAVPVEAKSKAHRKTAAAHGGKIVLCHIPPGNPAAQHTIRVKGKAAIAHLAHGDTVGECEKVKKEKDKRAPEITAVTVAETTATSAKISWTTDEPSTSKVFYVLVSPATVPRDVQMAEDATLVTSHSVTLNGLQAGSKYFFVVQSKDAASNVSTSAPMMLTTQFTPPPPADTTAPVISELRATAVTQTSTMIKWVTDEPSTSLVDYATAPLASASTVLAAESGTMVTAHMIPLTGLTASTTYYFRVKSKDAAGNVATSGEMMFTTLAAADVTGPVITGLTATSTTSNSATIKWTTNEPSTSRVIFAQQPLSSATTIWSVFSSLLTGMHDIMLSGLSAATQYFFRVESTDAAGNTTSIEQSFTTQP